ERAGEVLEQIAVADLRDEPGEQREPLGVHGGGGGALVGREPRRAAGEQRAAEPPIGEPAGEHGGGRVAGGGRGPGSPHARARRAPPAIRRTRATSATSVASENAAGQLYSSVMASGAARAST